MKIYKKFNTIGIGKHPQKEAENRDMQLWSVKNILMIFSLLTPNNELVIQKLKIGAILKNKKVK